MTKFTSTWQEICRKLLFVVSGELCQLQVEFILIYGHHISVASIYNLEMHKKSYASNSDSFPFKTEV